MSRYAPSRMTPSAMRTTAGTITLTYQIYSIRVVTSDIPSMSSKRVPQSMSRREQCSFHNQILWGTTSAAAPQPLIPHLSGHNFLGLPYRPTVRRSNPLANNAQGRILRTRTNVAFAFAIAIANDYNLIIHTAGATIVDLGGYNTRGGHTLIRFQKRLAADGILELSAVLPVREDGDGEGMPVPGPVLGAPRGWRADA